ncbi:Replicative DNA helicase [subsurface metagenome]
MKGAITSERKWIIKNMKDKLKSLMVSNPEAEKAVLYCILYFEDLGSRISELKKEDFYNKNHQEIFSYFCECISNGKVIDPATVPDRIRNNPEWFSVINICAMKSHYNDYVSELKDMASKRSLGKLAVNITSKVQEETKALEIKKFALETLGEIRNVNIKSIKTSDIFDSFEEDILLKDNIGGLGTGLPSFDDMTKGFCPGTLNIVGGTPAVGKTTFILNIANHICKKGKKVLYVSLEMDYIMLYAKLVSIITGISVSKLLSTKKNLSQSDWTSIMNAGSGMSEYQLYLMGEEKTYVYDIENEAKNLGVDIIFVDYLQLVNPENGRKNRYEEISGISRDLKKLATNLNIPIVTVASINRSYSTRLEKRPVIADIRDSGNIEYDADVIIFLYRESIFREPKPTEDVEEFLRHGELILAKNRYGICNMTIDLYWNGDKSLFRESI